MKTLFLTSGLLLVLGATACFSQDAGLLGNWKTPTGSIIRVDVCDAGICMNIVKLSPSAPATTDIHNPDPKLRSRPLCGLRIGHGFSLEEPKRASGGTLYDPKTGKTYRGAITADGATLHLRGYVGIPLFGASQDWTRAAAPTALCASRDPRPSGF